MSKIKIGVIREGKTPPDFRVPLPPQHCYDLLQQYSNTLSIAVQPSPSRCFKDREYADLGIVLQEDLSDCDILLGVKEVPKNHLIPEKKYLFFSHTIKKQAYNRALLNSILQKNIELIDYETLRWENGKRIIGFGVYAGIVGAHNGLLVYGKRSGHFDLPEACKTKDLATLQESYKKINLPPIKIVITGNGRVAQGSLETIRAMGIREVTKTSFLKETFAEAVFVYLKNDDLYRRKADGAYDKQEFYNTPQKYESVFAPYTKVTDLLIHGIYWNPNAPQLFSKADMRLADFKIEAIADISCDIEGSIPATLKATKIGDMVMGYDPVNEKEMDPYQPTGVDIMSIDNLPNELPRDASVGFGKMMQETIIPELLKANSAIISGARITKNGHLCKRYGYLQNYVDGKA
ncbi:MAG: NAD(P)-dependent oxidoreductase [Chitinophagales bacterium]